MARDKALEDAIKFAGGVGALAEELGITQAAVSQWERVPPLQVIGVERATKGRVTRYKLRPDIYPLEDASARK